MPKSIVKSKKKTLTFFILKLIILFSAAFVVDHLIGSLLGYFYFKEQSGVDYRTTYSMEKTKADLLIFGSSRANHHYQPDIFEKSLGLSSYNVGEDGNTILNDYAVLKSVLARYSPEIVILDLKAQDFIKKQEDYDQLSELLPYYSTHPEIRSIINLKSRFEKEKLLSSIYPYNSIIFRIAAGNMRFYKRMREDIKGYVPLRQQWKGSLQIDPGFNKYEIDSNKIKIYQFFIQDCIHSKTKLFIVSSPYLMKTAVTELSIKIGKEIAEKYNINFFDYSRSPLFTNQFDLFADNVHLNDRGANVFSTMIANNLLRISNINNHRKIAFNDRTVKKTW